MEKGLAESFQFGNPQRSKGRQKEYNSFGKLEGNPINFLQKWLDLLRSEVNFQETLHEVAYQKFSISITNEKSWGEAGVHKLLS